MMMRFGSKRRKMTILFCCLLEFKMFPRQEAKSIYSTVSHPWPPSLPHTHPLGWQDGQQKGDPPPLLQKLLTAGNDWRKRPRSQNMICSVLLGSTKLLLSEDAKDTKAYLFHVLKHVALFFCRRWQNHVERIILRYDCWRYNWTSFARAKPNHKLRHNNTGGERQKARQKQRREVCKSKKEEEAHGRCFDLSSESKSIKFLKKPERKMQRLLTLDFWLLL